MGNLMIKQRIFIGFLAYPISIKPICLCFEVRTNEDTRQHRPAITIPVYLYTTTHLPFQAAKVKTTGKFMHIQIYAIFS
jgi:hypothetical protein